MSQNPVDLRVVSRRRVRSGDGQDCGCAVPTQPSPPRRGRYIRPCFGHTTELGCRVSPKRKTKKRGLQLQHSNFPAPLSALPLLGERVGVRGNEANSHLRCTTPPATVKLRESTGRAG